MRPRRSLTAAVLAVLGWTATTGLAHAHDELLSSTPVDGQSVESSPQTVELEFAGAVQALGGGTAVVVSEAGAAGAAVVSTGDVEVDGSFVRQALEPDLPDGEYVVAYRVISSDGHEVEGSTRFFVGPVPAEVSTVPPGAPFGVDEDEPAGGVPASVLLVVGILVVVVVAGLVVWRGRRRRGSS